MVRARTAGNNFYEGQTYLFYRKFAYKTKHPKMNFIYDISRAIQFLPLCLDIFLHSRDFEVGFVEVGL